MDQGPLNTIAPAQDVPPRANGEFLIQFLNENEVACPGCNYNLKGLTSSRCPECGQELKLSVGLVESYLKAWITLSVALCASAGIGSLFGYFVIKEGLPHEGYVDLAIIYFILTIPPAILVLRLRKRFMRLSRDLQWTLAVVATFLFLVAFAMVAHIS